MAMGMGIWDSKPAPPPLLKAGKKKRGQGGVATNPNLERMNIGKPAPPRTQKKEKWGDRREWPPTASAPPLQAERKRAEGGSLWPPPESAWA